MEQQLVHDDTENPFGKDEEAFVRPKTEYFWIKLSPWNWILTEDIDAEESKPYYDFKIEGTFLDTETNCPFCGGQESIFVQFGYVGFVDGWPTFEATEWCCQACGLCGQVEGSYGNGAINPLPQEAPPLPDEICIVNDEKPESGGQCYRMNDFCQPAYIVISDEGYE